MPNLTEARALYDLPLNTLIFKAQQVHQAHQDPAGVQLCTPAGSWWAWWTC